MELKSKYALASMLLATQAPYLVVNAAGDDTTIIAVSGPTKTQKSWINKHGQKLDFQRDAPLCGAASDFDWWAEDRTWKFSVCNIEASEYAVKAGSQETAETWWQETFSLMCNKDKVITGLSSYHDSWKDDRRWVATCTHFKDTVVDEDTCEGFDGDFQNEFGKPLSFQCAAGKVLTGIHSEFDSYNEDRRYKFNCCNLMSSTDPANSTLITQSDVDPLTADDWTGYVNAFDEKMEIEASVDGNAGGLCGMGSYFSRRYEDRRFTFKQCAPGDEDAILEKITAESVSIFFDEVSNMECPENSVITYMSSDHSDELEDRKWDYKCGSFKGWSTDLCQWNKDWVNYYDAPFTFDCGSQHVIAGIVSQHDRKHEDRRFKFKCCRWTKDPPKSSETDICSMSTLETAPKPAHEIDFSDPDSKGYELVGKARIVGPAPEGVTSALRIDHFASHAKLLDVDISPSKMKDATIMVTVYLESIKEGSSGWILSHDNGKFDRAIILHDDRFNGMGISTGKVASVWNEKTLPETKKWVNFVAIFRQGGDCSLFVDGVKAPISLLGQNNDGHPNLSIGQPEQHYRHHDADIWVKNVKVFDRALDDSEAAALYCTS